VLEIRPIIDKNLDKKFDQTIDKKFRPKLDNNWIKNRQNLDQKIKLKNRLNLD